MRSKYWVPAPAPPTLTSDADPPWLKQKAYGELGDVGQATLDLWNNCTTGGGSSKTCTQVQGIKDFFVDDYKACFGRHGELEPVDRALRRLIERMDPGDPGWPPLIEGGAHTFLFATELPVVPAEEAEVALGVDGAHRLVLNWRSRLARPAVQQSTVLLEGVKRLDIQYWRQDTGAWLNTWLLHSLPALVRLRVVFPPSDPRHWPDLIAAPMRARRLG